MVLPMNEKPLPSPATRTDEREEAVLAGSAGEPCPPAATSIAAERSPVTVTHVSHEVLFDEPPLQCDVCDAPLHGDETDDQENAFAGRGLYVWIRGGKVVYEEPPLCANCGTAIGMSALARWDIEEEEG
jgi:hypothetical protein